MNENPSAFEIFNSDKENPGRMGEHHLAVEDPFETEHDLSRVVRAEGELRIRNELLRAAMLFGSGSTWKEICVRLWMLKGSKVWNHKTYSMICVTKMTIW